MIKIESEFTGHGLDLPDMPENKIIQAAFDATQRGSRTRGLQLQGRQGYYCHLRTETIERWDLSNSLIRFSTFSDSHFDNCNLDGAVFEGVRFGAVSFYQCSLKGAKFRSCIFQWCRNAGDSLKGATLYDSCIFADSMLDVRGALFGYEDISGDPPEEFGRHGIVTAVTRSDGYVFMLLNISHRFMVRAGCRYFTMPEAWEHWQNKRFSPSNHELGAETIGILSYFQGMIHTRKSAWNIAQQINHRSEEI